MYKSPDNNKRQGNGDNISLMLIKHFLTIFSAMSLLITAVYGFFLYTEYQSAVGVTPPVVQLGTLIVLLSCCPA